MKFYDSFPILVVLVTLTKFCQSQTDETCTDKEIKRAACIHGKCYVMLFDDLREPSCICHPEYAGSRCKELNLELISFANPNVYIIIGVIILVIIIAAIVFIMCYRRVKGLPLSNVLSGEEKQRTRLVSVEEAELQNLSDFNRTVERATAAYRNTRS